MRPAHFIQNLLPRFEAQMVCIIQAQHAACLLQLVIRQSLEGRLCRNRHEDGKWHGAMREMEGASARFGCLCMVTD
jgi:hypothetical protein